MTQDEKPALPPTRDDLERTLWELTKWRGSAETMNRLLAAIDEYADAKLKPVEVVYSPRLVGFTKETDLSDGHSVCDVHGRRDCESCELDLEVADAAAALDDDLDEPTPGEHDYREWGYQLVALVTKAHRELTSPTGSEAYRFGQLAELFGNGLAASYWMRVAAGQEDELAASWLRELGDGMAFTPGLDLVPETVLEDAKKAFETRVNAADLESKPDRDWVAVPGTVPLPSGSTTVHLVTITNPVPQVDAVEGVFEIEWDKVAPPRPYVASRVTASAAPMVSDDGEPMKPCKVCRQPKVLSEFTKDSSCRDGRRNQCKVCVNRQHREQKKAKTR